MIRAWILTLLAVMVLAEEDIFEFSAVSKGPHLIDLSWSDEVSSDFSLAYREQDAKESWLILGPPDDESSSFRLLFRRPEVCSTYEFRLRRLAVERGDNVTEVTTAVPPQAPRVLRSATPRLRNLSYDRKDQSVRAIFAFAVEETKDAKGPKWPREAIRLKPYVHMLDCGDRAAGLTAPMPVRLNGTHFGVSFPREYLGGVIENGSVCEALLIFEPEASICLRRVPIQEDLDSNSAILRISCATVFGLPCSISAAVPPIDCSPTDLRARGLWKQNAILLEWSFAPKKVPPMAVHLRYGLRDLDSLTDRIKGELGRREVSPSQRGMLLPLPPASVASQPHLISVCARYSPSQRLSWTKAPARLISLQKRYPKVRLSSAEAEVERREMRGMRERTREREADQPAGCGKGFSWRPVAITLTLFTIANLVLLGMSSYLYSRAKKVTKFSDKRKRFARSTSALSSNLPPTQGGIGNCL